MLSLVPIPQSNLDPPRSMTKAMIYRPFVPHASKADRKSITGQNQSQQATDYGVRPSDIKLDLTAGQGRPEWIFSAYAPNKDVPRQLFGGAHRERSMEEMRLRHYELAAAGNLDQAVQEASALWQECVQQIEVSLNDLNGAVKYIIDGKDEHPNRIDIVEGKTQATIGQAPAPFGQPSPFGQQNAPSSAPAAGAFGAPSSTFGQPSGLGQSGGFGQTSAMGPSPAFGQPSTLGGSAFGQPSTLGAQPAFGKPGFSQQAATPSPFGQPSAMGGAAPFGAPSAPAAPSPFSQISQNQQPAAGGFGQPTGQPAPSPFGQPAGQPAPSPFGQQAPKPNPFGAPSAPAAAAPFGAPSAASPFGQVSQNQQPATGGFGQPAGQPAPSPFGQPAAQPAAPSVPSVPVQNANVGPRAFIKIDNPQDLNPLPQLEGETRHNPSTKQLVMWKGRPVKYVDSHPCYLHPQDNKTFVRIHFPNGPPDAANLKDSQGKPEEYTPEVVEAYQFFLQNGYFKDGNIPALAPQREWLSFDF
ncbi:uncharacterized protein N7515_008179 [Penicillium bovifimosum]|uniref:CCCH zinc finger domain protein n=1 Tax=Penicillium bovifimosum TaxID=126998 RepID=A0A9W9GMT2_9EURO|nr:uncharacterized protein N7515_008179 [Penicillium bovifimosum]KAJ5124354.1 hypothetical protein N7515_008179 [Penicillium bovifimosum]